IVHNSLMMRISAIALLGLGGIAVAHAEPIAQCDPQRFFPDFEPRSLEFAVAVAISDEHLLIADRFADKVYTYRRDGLGAWVLNHTVPGSSGGAVQLDSYRFITGSLGVERYGGAVIYEFDGDRWSEVAQLESPDDPVYSSSGYVVALHGQAAAFTNWGTRVALFRETDGEWEFVRELRGDVAQPGGPGFGGAMAMDERFFVVSAPFEDVTGVRNGAVYVYRWDDDGEPELVQKLLPEPADFGPSLGTSLALEGDTLVVGAVFDGVDRDLYGAAFVYGLVDGRWELSQKITAPQPTNGAYFGSVALHGDVLAVGAHGEFSGGDGVGTVHLYRRSPAGLWKHAEQVTLSGTFGEGYGARVSLSSTQLVTGARDARHMGFDQGVADVYDLDCLLCAADFDADGRLTLFDFLAFFNAFEDGDPIADFDRDGEFTLFDFLAFQDAFDAGCG
ncbi:MAG: FG-GAP repeat protein, partial [Planctomycetota bacterium]